MVDPKSLNVLTLPHVVEEWVFFSFSYFKLLVILLSINYYFELSEKKKERKKEKKQKEIWN
jgi:hypothetical protein